MKKFKHGPVLGIQGADLNGYLDGAGEERRDIWIGRGYGTGNHSGGGQGHGYGYGWPNGSGTGGGLEGDFWRSGFFYHPLSRYIRTT